MHGLLRPFLASNIFKSSIAIFLSVAVLYSTTVLCCTWILFFYPTVFSFIHSQVPVLCLIWILYLQSSPLHTLGQLNSTNSFLFCLFTRLCSSLLDSCCVRSQSPVLTLFHFHTISMCHIWGGVHHIRSAIYLLFFCLSYLFCTCNCPYNYLNICTDIYLQNLQYVSVYLILTWVPITVCANNPT